MQYYKLEITIKPDGSIAEKVISGSGSGCTKVTEDLNEAIGSTESQEFLPEYLEDDNDNSLLTQPVNL
jgi:hypothetical protein